MAAPNNFAEFEEGFQIRFASIAEKYPLSFQYFEKFLRQFHAQRNILVEKSVQKLRARNKKRRFRARIKNFISLPVRNFQNSDSIICDVSRAPAIGTVLNELAADRETSVLSQLPLSRGKRFLTLRDAIVCAEGYEDALQVLNLGSTDEVVKNHDKFAAFEKSIKQIINHCTEPLKVLNVRGVVSHNLHSEEGLVLNLAAQSIGIPTIEIAHGYTADALWTTAWPVRANYLVMWADEVVERAKRDFDRSGKTLSFGPPFSSAARGNDVVGKILLLLDPKNPGSNVNQHLERMELFGKRLNELGHDVMFRAHPKCWAHNDIKDYSSFILNRLSRQTLNDDLSSCRCVIGTVSSVFLEANARGIPSFQLSDSFSVRMQGSEIIQEDQIEYLDTLIQKSSNQHQDFDYIRCRQFFDTTLFGLPRCSVPACGGSE